MQTMQHVLRKAARVPREAPHLRVSVYMRESVADHAKYASVGQHTPLDCAAHAEDAGMRQLLLQANVSAAAAVDDDNQDQPVSLPCGIAVNTHTTT